MRLFLDSANLEEIARAWSMGVISGVTTNPSLLRKEGARDFRGHVRRICELVEGDVSVEVLSQEFEGMVEEALGLVEIHPSRVVVKIPMTEEGLKATKLLSSKGIKVNVTLVFSPAQALLAALAGARYVSPFVGRMEDAGFDGLSLVGQTLEVLLGSGLRCEVIAASIRNVRQLIEVARMGCHVATVPFGVISSSVSHHLTSSGLERFKRDWEELMREHV